MKVTINGVVHEYDGKKAPMSEALAVERVYKHNYAQWQSDLQAGSAEAMAVLAWVILRRDGSDVKFEDILDGTFDFDLLEMLTSITEAAEAEAADPTIPGASPGRDGTPTTGTNTSSSSRKSSGSAPGK